MGRWGFSVTFLALTFWLSSCGQEDSSASKSDLDRGSQTTADYFAVDTNPPAPDQPVDPLRLQIGSMFMVEHFQIEANDDMLAAIQAHPPGALVFWNPKNVPASALKALIQQYSKANKDSGLPPILFAADEEGGGLRITPNGKDVLGVQRFKKGFTLLPHPTWLGYANKKYSNTKACSLHGKILSHELESAGLNWALSIPSDLRTTLMYYRSISTEPKVISDCLTEVVKQFAQTHVIFTTKHFPGLGMVDGDTHDSDVVASHTTMEDLQNNLIPFVDLMLYTENNKITDSFSLMASHAIYPQLDPDHKTTESAAVLRGLLRNNLKYRGLVLSDAMWMGGYAKLTREEAAVAYLNSFLNGMDVLMIPGQNFATSIRLFRAVYDNKPGSWSDPVQQKTGLSWIQVRDLFMSRLNETLARLKPLRLKAGYAVDLQRPLDHNPDAEVPNDVLTYNNLLLGLSPEFQGYIK